MTAKKEGVEKFEVALEEIIKTAEKYKNLWPGEDIWAKLNNPEKDIYLAGGFLAQDETFYIALQRKGERFSFYGRNFESSVHGLCPSEAARAIVDYLGDFDITPDKITANFYEKLSDLVGIHLAKEEFLKMRGNK